MDQDRRSVRELGPTVTFTAPIPQLLREQQQQQQLFRISEQQSHSRDTQQNLTHNICTLSSRPAERCHYTSVVSQKSFEFCKFNSSGEQMASKMISCWGCVTYRHLAAAAKKTVKKKEEKENLEETDHPKCFLRALE